MPEVCELRDAQSPSSMKSSTNTSVAQQCSAALIPLPGVMSAMKGNKSDLLQIQNRCGGGRRLQLYSQCCRQNSCTQRSILSGTGSSSSGKVKWFCCKHSKRGDSNCMRHQVLCPGSSKPPSLLPVAFGVNLKCSEWFPLLGLSCNAWQAHNTQHSPEEAGQVAWWQGLGMKKD